MANNNLMIYSIIFDELFNLLNFKNYGENWSHEKQVTG